MTRENFRQAVELRAVHLAPVARERALKEYEDRGNTEKWHIDNCVNLAKDFDEFFNIAPPPTESSESSESVGSDAAVSRTSAGLREMIAKDVDQVREDLFGATTPPFSSCEDAGNWLGGLQLRGERSEEDLVRAQSLHAEWLADPRRQEVEEITGVPSLVTRKAHLIPYLAPDGTHVTPAAVGHGSPFVKLETVSKHLANATGFGEADVVMHILCDSPLSVPSIRTTKVIVFGNRRRCFRVEFNSPDVTQAQMMNLLGLVRAFWGRAGGRRLTKKDLSFLELIEERGGVPDSGRKEFFEPISQICTARKIGNYERSGWRGPYRRWDRLMKRETKLGTQED